MSNTEILQNGYRYALSITGNRHDAEDLVHDAWLRVYKKYGPFTNKYLLFRTIRNQYIDEYRKLKPFSFENIEDHGELAGEAQEFLNDEILTKEEVKSALDTLRPEERQAIYLNFYEGFSAAKIAKINKLPRSTVLSMLQRG